MTTPNHFAQGYIACHIAGLPTELCVIGGVAMASNDLHGWYDSISLIIKTKSLRARDWRHRKRYHEPSIWLVGLVFLSAFAVGLSTVWADPVGWFIPLFPLVHALFDWGLHKKEGGINGFYIPAEVATWLVMIVYTISGII